MHVTNATVDIELESEDEQPEDEQATQNSTGSPGDHPRIPVRVKSHNTTDDSALDQGRTNEEAKGPAAQLCPGGCQQVADVLLRA